MGNVRSAIFMAPFRGHKRGVIDPSFRRWEMGRSSASIAGLQLATAEYGASIYDVRKIFGFFTFPPFVYSLSAKLGYFLTPTPLSAEWGRHIWKPPSADYLTAQFLKSSFRAMDELWPGTGEGCAKDEKRQV